MVLILDNYDSFTYNLRDYILQLGLECMVVRNDEMTVEELEKIDFSSVVISPGPRTPAEAGITMPFIERFYASKPILGICLGHQALGEFFGAKLVKAAKPMHGKTSVIKHSGHFLFNGLPSEFEVMRYHSLIIDDVATTDLNVVAVSPVENAPGLAGTPISYGNEEIMAIAHKDLKIAGVQFHPESILTPHGIRILKNWFDNI
jgi:anthranilate synthase/aminodeoxychorismate synthase-like glutamine amidotransferase